MFHKFYEVRYSFYQKNLKKLIASHFNTNQHIYNPKSTIDSTSKNLRAEFSSPFDTVVCC